MAKTTFCLFFVMFVTLSFIPVAQGDTLTVVSRLQVETFQSDFAYINWYFRTNVTDPESSMVIVIALDNLTSRILPVSPTTLSINKIDKELDVTTNLTNFFIEGAIPLGTISSDFPNDRYEANYFIGCNFITENESISLGGAIPGPTDNYQISWDLTTEPTFKSQLSDQTRFFLTTP
jgi:hypothetical protein